MPKIVTLGDFSDKIAEIRWLTGGYFCAGHVVLAIFGTYRGVFVTGSKKFFEHAAI